jgi:predicted RNA methylase
MHIVKRMVALADLKTGEVVYDLGAGDARLLITSKKQTPEITAIGYELVPTVWLLGKIRILLSGSRITWKMADVRTADFHDADCIFLYLLPGVLEQLLPLFDAQLKPGTRVISSVFPLEGRKLERTEAVQWMGGERKVQVYRW